MYEEIAIESDNRNQKCKSVGSESLDYMQIRLEDHRPWPTLHHFPASPHRLVFPSATASRIHHRKNDHKQICHPSGSFVSVNCWWTRGRIRPKEGGEEEGICPSSDVDGRGEEQVVGVLGNRRRRRRKRVKRLPSVAVEQQKDETGEREHQQWKLHNGLFIRRQILSNGIRLIPLLFLLLLVTTSALPPVIRIGKLATTTAAFVVLLCQLRVSCQLSRLEGDAKLSRKKACSVQVTRDLLFFASFSVYSRRTFIAKYY